MNLKSKSHLDASIKLAAEECIAGKHLNGNDRVESLRDIGFSNDQIMKIQRLVNHKMSLRKK